ncbi:hypothetical protein FQA39_LY07683 [Lamprigera yunnana]|nr:hypothetical protein FQA39_LY07683 [Lamprigera yunnana]
MADLERLIYKDGIIEIPDCSYPKTTGGAGCRYFDNITKNKDRVFQVDALTGEEDSYGAVLQRSIRTALKMRSLGVTPDDMISTCSFNHLNTFVPYISALFLGATTVNFDAKIPISESIHSMNLVHPKIIFVAERDVEYMETLLNVTNRTAILVVFGKSDKYMEYSEFTRPIEGEDCFVPIDVDDSKIAYIVFTSGSTGFPKGICVSHRAHVLQVAQSLSIDTAYDVMLLFSRLSWATSLHFCGVTILGGFKRITAPKFQSNLAWNIINDYKPTFMFLSPFQIATMRSDQELYKRDVSSLKLVIIGGGFVYDHQIMYYRKLFPNAKVTIGYGQTEVGSLTYFVTDTRRKMKFMTTKIKSVGSALNGIAYKVVDVDTEQTLGFYRTGELRIKCKHLLSGYHNRDSSDAWDSDGWFKTGDLVYYDEDYYFYYVERIKELIKYQSTNVFPKLLEKVLLMHPNVTSAYVVSIPHDIDGEHPVAFILLKDYENGHNIEAELNKCVEEHLGDNYKLRGGIRIIKALPITATGKVHTRELKNMAKSFIIN